MAYDQTDAAIVFAGLNYPLGSTAAVVDDVTKTVLSGPTWVRREVVPKGMMEWEEFVNNGVSGDLAPERLINETARLKQNKLKLNVS